MTSPNYWSYFFDPVMPLKNMWLDNNNNNNNRSTTTEVVNYVINYNYVDTHLSNETILRYSNQVCPTIWFIAVAILYHGERANMVIFLSNDNNTNRRRMYKWKRSTSTNISRCMERQEDLEGLYTVHSNTVYSLPPSSSCLWIWESHSYHLSYERHDCIYIF